MKLAAKILNHLYSEKHNQRSFRLIAAGLADEKQFPTKSFLRMKLDLCNCNPT